MKTEGASKRVGIWIRVSTEDQVRGESPEHHEKRARAYAKVKDWEVAEVYRLEAVSGKTVRKHSETQRMLDDVKNRRIDALIFSKLARLARNTRELLDFSELFQEAEADLVSLQEAIDTSTPAGRLFYTIIAAMAQWEREEISERVAASVPVRAKMGKPLGGPAMFGYQWVDQKLVPNPDEEPILREMFELFLKHQRLKTVARLLNEKGYRTRKGAKFSDTTVSRLLQNPTAKGEHIANYTRNTTGNRTELKPESEWITVAVEPVVSEETWNQCNQILGKRKGTRAKRIGRKPHHLFTGLVICQCGQKMYVPSNTPKYVCYGCRNKIPVDDLEEIYLEELRNFFVSSDEIEKYLAGADRHVREKTQLLEVSKKEQANIARQMDTLIDLYGEKKLSPDEFGDRFAPLEERKKSLQSEISAIQAQLDLLRVDFLTAEHIMSEGKDIHSRWPKLANNERRQLVENLTDDIRVGDKTIDINLVYFPSLEKMTTKQRNLRDSSPPPA